MIWVLKFVYLICWVWLLSIITLTTPTAGSATTERIYFLKKCGGAGCPYTASWLIHVNLYRKLTWWLDVTKMEAASFNVFDKSKLKFQLSDPDAYFVHHMSMYEHFLHKKVGFATALNKTIIMSQAAFKGECENVHVSDNKDYVALIPFYGGLPPNVTKDLSVKSIGQGNSLVDTSTKALQATAAVCSCLKYFGRVVIGVARQEDKAVILDMIGRLSNEARKNIMVVHFKMHRPANLPFHLIAWGQHYVKHHNCKRFYTNDDHTMNDVTYGFESRHIDTNKLSEHPDEVYDVCYPNSFPMARGGPMNVTFTTKTEFSDAGESPIKYIYFSECDQIVRFDSVQTQIALTAASNDSTFFTGRRKEKNYESHPHEYMGGLTIWRECGVPGYSLSWPKSKFVQHDG